MTFTQQCQINPNKKTCKWSFTTFRTVPSHTFFFATSTSINPLIQAFHKNYLFSGPSKLQILTHLRKIKNNFRQLKKMKGKSFKFRRDIFSRQFLVIVWMLLWPLAPYMEGRRGGGRGSKMCATLNAQSLQIKSSFDWGSPKKGGKKTSKKRSPFSEQL